MTILDSLKRRISPRPRTSAGTFTRQHYVTRDLLELAKEGVEAGENKTQLAQRLGMDRSTFYRLLRRGERALDNNRMIPERELFELVNQFDSQAEPTKPEPQPEPVEGWETRTASQLQPGHFAGAWTRPPTPKERLEDWQDEQISYCMQTFGIDRATAVDLLRRNGQL